MTKPNNAARTTRTTGSAGTTRTTGTTRALQLLRAVQLPSCALMFLTGISEAFSLTWLDGPRNSAYGDWIWGAAFVLCLMYLGEWIFSLLPGRPKPLAGEGTSGQEPVLVDPPVTGHWEAVNSPADKVPSHGTHWGGQSHAIDLRKVTDDSGAPAPGFALLRLRRPEEFPAYGSPILAPAVGTVVSTVDGQRDHRARTSVFGLLYFFLVEQFVRSFAPADYTFGNHVVLRLDDGTYAELCHLRRGSLAVREGDTVTAGQLLGDCGNSGNSTEPHLHFQLMDRAGGGSARGVPFSWRGIGVPAGGERFTVPTEAAADQIRTA